MKDFLLKIFASVLMAVIFLAPVSGNFDINKINAATAPTGITATTGDATVTTSSVTLTGTINGGMSPYRFEYHKIVFGSYPDPTDQTTDGISPPSGQVSKIIQASVLINNLDYVYRLGFLKNSIWTYGTEKQFHVGATSGNPTVTIDATINPSDTSAGLTGSVSNIQQVGLYKLSLLTVNVPGATPVNVPLDWSANTTPSTVGGSLSFTATISGLAKLTAYTATIDPTGATTLTNTNIKTISFTTLAAPAGQIAPPGNTQTDYPLLASMPNLGTAGCKDANGNVINDPVTNLPKPCVQTAAPGAFGDYLNTLIKLFIGICAILAMIMIVIGGLQYMTSELGSGKEAGKERITNAIIGLLIALGSFALLNTINPQLLNVSLNGLTTATVTQDFQVSGGSTYNGQPIKVNFNTEAYPAAKIASQKTGVSIAFILAIFSQETASGGNTGKCDYTNANMKPGELAALQTVVNDLNKAYPSLGLTYQTVNMSCAAGASTYGGAIGYTQFLPSTWNTYKNTAAGFLGQQPNPWKAGDALMMTAVYLKHLENLAGGNEKEAACKYFGGDARSCSYSPGINAYGDGVMGRELSIQAQINAAIKSGTITP